MLPSDLQPLHGSQGVAHLDRRLVVGIAAERERDGRGTKGGKRTYLGVPLVIEVVVWIGQDQLFQAKCSLVIASQRHTEREAGRKEREKV